jgi:hypothetical protein
MRSINLLLFTEAWTEATKDQSTKAAHFMCKLEQTQQCSL